MSVYRLEAISRGQKDPRWARSHVKGMVWAGAATPEDARKLVALKTLTYTPPRADRLIVHSPWYDDRLVTCVLDTTRNDVPDGRVIQGDGTPLM
jgi:hypothetical protein